MSGKGIRGAFKVTGSAAPLTDDAKLAAADRELPALRQEPDRRAARSRRQEFVDAVKAGDVAKAKALFPVARTYWERIEPVAEIFGDLDPKIDGREEVIEEGMEFTGFHRIEKDLWVTGDISKSGPMADQLMADIKEIVAMANAEKLSPLQLANGAKELLDEVATGKITGEEDRYSHTDLWDFNANLEGSKAAVAALRPVLEERAPALVKTLDEEFAAVETALEQAPRGRRLEAAQRAVPGRAEGAVRRDQRAGRAGQQGRRGRRQSEPARSAAAPRGARPMSAARLSAVGQMLAGAGAGGGRRGRRPGATARPTATGRPVRRPGGAGRRRAVLRRAPGRHRHAGAGPAALRGVRRHHRPSATSWSSMLREWTAAAARMTAGQDAGADRRGRRHRRRRRRTTPARRSTCRPSGLTLTVGFGAIAVPRRRRAATGSASPTAGPPALADLPHFPGDALRPEISGGDLVRAGVRERPAGRRARGAQPGPHRLRRGQRALVAARLRPYVVDVARRRPRRATCSGSRTARANLKAEDADAAARAPVGRRRATGRPGWTAARTWSPARSG